MTATETPATRSQPPALAPTTLRALTRLDRTVLLALGALAAFRAGALPGGTVGADVVLAAAGWWFASAGLELQAVRERARDGWSVLWPPVVAAVVLAAIWVAVASSTRHDALVRGEALATLGGYANWHQLAFGPGERSSTGAAVPLQQMWLVAVAAQCALVWLVVVATTRSRAARRPAGPDPAVTGGLVLGGLGLAAGVVLLASGASGATVLLSTPVRGAACFLGAAAGAASGTPRGMALPSLARRCRAVGVGGLLVVAVLGAPMDPVGRIGAVVAPLLAAIVVVAALPAPGAHAPTTSIGRFGWSALTAACVLVTPSVALVRTALPGVPPWAIGVVGLVLAALASWGVAWLGALRSTAPVAVERRKVLVPPLVALLVIALFSLTGAFHWEAPQTIDHWVATR